MTGPGKVYLQSLPFSRLVDRVKRGITFTQSGGEQKGFAGIGGDIVRISSAAVDVIDYNKAFRGFENLRKDGFY